PPDVRVAGKNERRPGPAPGRDHGGSAELHRHHAPDRSERGEALAVEANGATVAPPAPDRVVWLAPHGPTGEWRLDINRPPLGSLTGMLFRALVDRLDDHIDDERDRLVRPSHLYTLPRLHPPGASAT